VPRPRRLKPRARASAPSPENIAKASRRSALGVSAEEAVADYLSALGLEILATNVRVGRFEIDLIARDGDTIVIIEVRTRGASSWQRALDSIDARKRARLRAAAARLWRDRFGKMPGIDRMRFDAASVTFAASGAVTVEVVRAAF
jgi:putative endonuclease